VVAHPGGASAARTAGRVVPGPVAGGGSRGNHGFPRENAAGRVGRVNTPLGAHVEAHVDGTPWQVNHQPVSFVREEWRVLDRWWTEEPVVRRYFELVLETGENTVVFHDGAGGAWYTQRGA